MILRYLGTALLGTGLGLWLGMQIEAATWTDKMSDLRDKAAKELERAQIAHADEVELIQAEHLTTVARYKEILEQARESERRARELARMNQERVHALNEQLASIREDGDGDSTASWGDHDLRMWNAGIEAVNDDVRAGVPRAGDADGS